MSDARDLHLKIDFQNALSTLIHSYLTFGGCTYIFQTSITYPPFRDLLNFLRAVATNRLPAWAYWDMEGRGIFFEGWPITEDSQNFHLRIHDDEHHVLMVDADLGRLAVVQALLKPIREMALYGMKVNLNHWDLTLVDVVRFENFLQNVVPEVAPRDDINRSQPIIFLRTEFGDGFHWLEIEMLERKFLNWRMADTDPCWPGLFEFVEQVLRGRPAVLPYYDLFSERWQQENALEAGEQVSQPEREWKTKLNAIPFDHPRNFRLQVYENHWNFAQKNLLIFDEVLDRVQFATAFLKMFETLIANNYEPTSDPDEITFDLRTLPAARLRDLIQQVDA